MTRVTCDTCHADRWTSIVRGKPYLMKWCDCPRDQLVESTAAQLARNVGMNDRELMDVLERIRLTICRAADAMEQIADRIPRAK